jgi:hypothetical protein
VTSRAFSPASRNLILMRSSSAAASDLVFKSNRARLPFLFRSSVIHQGLVFEKG